MNLALTLVIQGVCFPVAWAVMKFFLAVAHGSHRRATKKIAAGIGGRQQERKGSRRAEARSKEILREARDEPRRSSTWRASARTKIVDEAKGTASGEARRLVDQARDEVAREPRGCEKAWPEKWASWRSRGASRLLEREIDPKTHAELLTDWRRGRTG